MESVSSVNQSFLIRDDGKHQLHSPYKDIFGSEGVSPFPMFLEQVLTPAVNDRSVQVYNIKINFNCLSVKYNN